jgi:nucleoid-associated protein YgaU
MQSIERYAVVILLFLVVTVAAVLMWNSSDDEEANTVAAAERSDRIDPSTLPAPRAEEGVIGLRTDPRRNRPLSRTQSRGPGQTPQGGGEREVTPERAEAVGSGGAGIVAHSPTNPVTPSPSAGTDPTIGTTTSPTLGAGTAPVSPPPAAIRRPRPGGASPNVYVVQPADTLSQIAMEKLGSWKRWREIVEANPGLDASCLKVGARLVLPPPSAAVASSAPRVATPSTIPSSSSPASPSASTGGGRTWKVAEGQSLWTIAERALGSGARWGEIATANPGIDVDRLKLGQILHLPDSAKRESSPVRTTPAASDDKVAVAAPTPTPSRGKVR